MNTWSSIGWHALLVLNKLRNERQIREGNAGNDEQRRDDDSGKDDAAADLASSNRMAGHQ